MHAWPPAKTSRFVRQARWKMPSVMIIEITENCNLRCKYCCYSGEHQFYRRRGDRTATREFLRRVIDWCVEVHDPLENQSVSFYGGEPLLSFEELMYGIEYAESVWPTNDRLHFSFTTNGTLLSLAYAIELARHGVHITVSLDGNQETHDWSRTDARGKGSFASVITNLRNLANHSDRRISAKLQITASIDNRTASQDFADWIALLRSEPWLIEIPKRFNAISVPVDADSLYKTRPTNQGDRAYWFLLREEIDKIASGEDTWLVKWLYAPGLRLVHERERTKISKNVYSYGACVPGLARLYVSIEGILYPCERVDRRFSIGTLESGVDEGKVSGIIQEWRGVINSVCTGCWAFRFCDAKCLGLLSGAPDLTSAMLTACRQIQQTWAWNLWFYCYLSERDSSALESLVNPRS